MISSRLACSPGADPQYSAHPTQTVPHATGGALVNQDEIRHSEALSPELVCIAGYDFACSEIIRLQYGLNDKRDNPISSCGRLADDHGALQCRFPADLKYQSTHPVAVSPDPVRSRLPLSARSG
jgi:hypothetical protein